MLDIKNAQCEEEGCSTQPNYGYEGDKRATRCSKHKKDGMLDIVSAQCEEEG